MSKESKNQKVLLIIRDGWGYSPETKYNMIAQADTPYTDYLEKNYPTFLLGASGESVGLPDGYFGNSEVGHMTIGAGRPLQQSLLRINTSIADASFFSNTEFLAAIDYVKKHDSKLHLIGLLQREGVHAHFDHLVALLELAKQHGLYKNDVCIHVITDGRDASEQNAIHYISDLENEIARIGVGYIASLGGRYFAMDRNQNWERTEKYYKAICNGAGYSGLDPESRIPKKTFIDPQKYLTEKYLDTEFSDEFLDPIVHENFPGIVENDSIIFFNFRKDRARQITRAFIEKDFSEFKTINKNILFTSMTEYFADLENVAFPDLLVENTLGEILERNRKTQLRITETEKYAHVTFFFDGGIDRDFVGAKKVLIPSPDVATFDLQPEMASPKITKKLIHEIKHSHQDFILCNFPNADMVGHTGDHNATKKGVEAVDKALGKIIPVALEHNYTIILAADHGNAEYKNDNFETSHTANKIPCTVISSAKFKLLDLTTLGDVCHLVLRVLDLK